MVHLLISISLQRLSILDGEHLIKQYDISTALNGAGELANTGCTPRGQHCIRAKIGDGLPLNAVMVGRRFTGEIYSQELAKAFPNRDWILTRILWLSGLEPGVNRLGDRDSMQRYIYIHGTPDSEPMGVPLSHGCVRMRNSDLIEVFNLVESGTRVDIKE
ncbi:MULTISPECIES: L,D-transpeptidase [unclassified Neptuniibacter]|uniref:L,D-transpeptidase n=1 Tax=unclassified Neptuniibacter TaxID=2630693 RepID=UPI000C471D62|nr:MULTISPECIES: L,D-transpeptidase [unclassified Neptuniibacter]MAY40820.1 L,D-transpeptidase [Oceanospirillaceae bacterium]|tara:strand:+ start:17240 stop:17719 length:480 start_codon:yes stop_codon:yes gene_type:complete